MALRPYFRQVPNFDYVNVNPSNDSVRNYITVKNLFKRGQIRSEIFKNVTYFTKYFIVGNQRPDNVAYDLYGESTLDWVVLLSNNILNLQNEWPLPQESFDELMLRKYGSYENLYKVHHYESIEQKDETGTVVFPGGLHVDRTFSMEYYSTRDGQVLKENITVPVTNYEYETRIEEKKRTIFTLKPKYLTTLFDDIEEIMEYKKGSEQYVSRTLKKGFNAKLFD